MIMVVTMSLVHQVLSVEYRDSLRLGKGPGKGGDSMVATVLNRLDPFAYSGVVALADRTQYLRSTVWWMVSVTWQTPGVFYGVYWKVTTSTRHDTLP